jgi:actin-related protein
MNIVIGNNSRTIQAGFGGDDAPRTVLPCVVGHYQQDLFEHMSIGDHSRSHLISYPVEDGIITNWEYMEQIWGHIFDNSFGTQRNVLLAETPLTYKPYREKLAQSMFETFNIPGLYLKNQDVLSLIASGNITGLVFDSGATNSRATPIFDGHALPQATCTTNIGGDDMTRLLVQDISNEQHHQLQTINELYRTNDIKENVCYVKGITEQPKSARQYMLPYSNIVTLTDSCYKCTEALFNPKLGGKPIDSIQDIINKAVRKCDKQVWRDLSDNIVLAGGNTMFEGLADRLTEEMNKISSIPVTITAPPDCNYLTWVGGSIFVSLSSMNDIWITNLYTEYGAGIVHCMCPPTAYSAESRLYSNISRKNAFIDVEIK